MLEHGRVGVQDSGGPVAGGTELTTQRFLLNSDLISSVVPGCPGEEELGEKITVLFFPTALRWALMRLLLMMALISSKRDFPVSSLL